MGGVGISRPPVPPAPCSNAGIPLLRNGVAFWGVGCVSFCCPVLTPPFFPTAAAFRALLQIRAMRKKLGPLSPTSFNPIIASQTSDSEEHSVSAWLRPAHPAAVGPPHPPPDWGGLGTHVLPRARIYLLNASLMLQKPGFWLGRKMVNLGLAFMQVVCPFLGVWLFPGAS